MVSYHLGDLESALTIVSVVLASSQLAPFQAFYSGTTALTIVRQKQGTSFVSRRKLQTSVRRCLNLLRSCSKHCQENCYHRVLLLEAEFVALRGDLELFMSKYAQAAELADQEGCLSYEYAGLTLRQFGRDN
jgi:hypothetical protein